MLKCFVFLLFTIIFSLEASAELPDVKLKSVRFKVSRPATLHTLVFKDPNNTLPKTTFELIPKNNNRIGLFLQLNSFLLGYSFDPFSNAQETKTTDLIFATEKFKHSRVGFNFQTLEGFDSEADSVFSSDKDIVFVPDLKSTRIELFGIHNLANIHNKSLFDHFYLNRPVDGEQLFGVSVVGSWNARYLRIESDQGVVYTPNFFNQPLLNPANEVRALQFSFSAGPMFSVGLKERFNGFLAAKLGTGYFQSLENGSNLKRTGFESLQSYSLGLSWNNSHKNVLVNSKFSFQKGRHIETSFGDVTLIFFF